MLPLARLAADGLPVPPAVVLPTDALMAHLSEHGLIEEAERAQDGDAEAAGQLHQALLERPLHPDTERTLRDVPRTLGGVVAVRSSGVEEDGRERSFAGQHHTSLGVQEDGIVDAVRRCWASLYAPGAMAYRGGQGPAVGGMAVLIQRLIDPDVAGVLFTINPVNGSWREMTVEAVWGLAEGLVSGQVSPHWYLVRRPRRTPRPIQRVLARVRLQQVQTDVHPIERRWVRRGNSVVVEPVPPSLRHSPTLSPHDLRRVCRLGLRVEAHLGDPQDVEWALDGRGRLWVLQARPVTTASAPRQRKEVVWTRRFVGERFPDPLTPLAWSLFEPTLDHFISYPTVQARLLGGGPALRRVNGRVYLNASVFPHLAFKLPGMPPPSFLLELMPPDEAVRFRRRFAVMPDLAVYRAIIAATVEERRDERFAWNPLTNPDVWARFETRLEDRLLSLAREPDSSADAAALVEDHLELLREYVGIHVCSLLFANLFDQVLEGLLSVWLPERATELRDALATTPAGNKTLEINTALWDLAQQAGDDDLAALEAAGVSGPFEAQIRAFLARYGQRSHASWDLFAPRWSEDPALLVPLLRAYRGSGAAAIDPRQHADAQQVRFERARSTLLEVASDGGRALVLERVVRLLRRYLLLRENQRFQFERIQASLRRTLGWLGDRWAADGVIEQPSDLRFLTWDEIDSGVGEQAQALRARIRDRRAALARHREASAPPFLRGDEVLPGEAEAGRLQGHGISPGRVTGRVRRVATLGDGDSLQPGEILVAPAVDPAWTPLFLVASGAILELGSRLSHGAVIAREYGVPAVVNVDGAMARLEDGAQVTVDGTRGLVFVHQE